MNVIKIGIVDDHYLLREGLINLLKNYPKINVVLEAENGKALLDALNHQYVDVILLDLELPVMSGGEAFEIIKSKHPDLKVIILSSHFNASYVIEYLKKGVCAFLNKNSRTSKIVEAIFSVYETGRYIDTALSLILAKATANSLEGKDREERPDLNLSLREIEIIELICRGLQNTEVANKLCLSVRTVEWHRMHIWKKTKCKSVPELISYAIQHNLITAY